ncbi:MAG: alpha/beta fold hydrolase [Solirubrobacterales bacterium]|nr:alpha/beta fold hydrolase [Solirubrobacterales bacterium]
MPATRQVRPARVAAARELLELRSGFGARAEPTPSDGPDPYGNDSPRPEWLEINWHDHLRRADVIGTEVNYVEMGSGPPLILVHGLAGCWQNWLENIAHLSRNHRVLALDLPGFGASPMPPWKISIPAYGRFLHDFCERLSLGSCSLVGNSMGGFIATEVAIGEPERVQRLALVSAAGVTWARARREPAAVFGRLARATGPLAFRSQMGGLRRPALRGLAYRGVFWNPRGIRPELLWEQTVPAFRAQGFYDAATSLAGYDIRHRLLEIEVPTLVVWGRNDRVVPVPAAAIYRRLIGDNARTVIFDDCGHLPQLERPVRFNRLMDEFLAA